MIFVYFCIISLLPPLPFIISPSLPLRSKSRVAPRRVHCGTVRCNGSLKMTMLRSAVGSAARGVTARWPPACRHDPGDLLLRGSTGFDITIVAARLLLRDILMPAAGRSRSRRMQRDRLSERHLSILQDTNRPASTWHASSLTSQRVQTRSGVFHQFLILYQELLLVFTRVSVSCDVIPPDRPDARRSQSENFVAICALAKSSSASDESPSP